MATERGRGKGRFFFPAGVWLAGLVALALIYQVAAWPAQWGPWRFEEGALFIPGWCGLLLPAATFAGGLAVSKIAESRALFLKGALLAVVTYALLAYASPVADHRRMVSRGADAAVQYPFGPYTPGGLLKIRDAVQENPPEEYSFRISRPLENPPNWWAYLLHSIMAVSGFTLLAALLGREVGVVTRAIPPPLRGNVRWGLGLATMVMFFLAERLASSWVQSDPGNSGVLGGWIALSVPLMELAILRLVARNQAADVQAQASSGV